MKVGLTQDHIDCANDIAFTLADFGLIESDCINACEELIAPTIRKYFPNYNPGEENV